jgi:hypothetical protein
MLLVVVGHVCGWLLLFVLWTCCSCQVVRGYVVGHVLLFHAVVGAYVSGDGRKPTTQVAFASYLSALNPKP